VGGERVKRLVPFSNESDPWECEKSHWRVMRTQNWEGREGNSVSGRGWTRKKRIQKKKKNKKSEKKG